MNKQDLINRVKAARNMVEVESLILTEVTATYLNTFAQNVRKFNRSNETYQSWTAAALQMFKPAIKETQSELFTLIPERLQITRMYKELQGKVFAA